MATYDEMKGAAVFDTAHNKIGTLDDFYVDDHTNQPTWVTVKTGLFGNKVSFVPLARAKLANDGLQIAFTKEQVKEAPHIVMGEQISEDDEAELYSYYSSALGSDLDHAQQPESDDQDDQQPRPAMQQPSTNPSPQATPQQAPTGGPTQSTQDNPHTELGQNQHSVVTATQPIEAGRVRLQKYVITENITFTVPIQREEVRVIRDGNDDTSMQTPDSASSSAPAASMPQGSNAQNTRSSQESGQT